MALASRGIGRQIIVVESEEPVRREYERALIDDGYVVTVVPDVWSACGIAQRLSPCVILVHAGALAKDAFVALRAATRATVIVMIGAVDEQVRVQLLRDGADVLCAWPISVAELQARVGALSRRWGAGQPEVKLERPAIGPEFSLSGIRLGGLSLDTSGRCVTVQGVPVKLSQTEYSVLYSIVNCADRVVTRAEIREFVWGTGNDRLDHAVDIHVSHLRHKLRDIAPDLPIIQTVWGVGFRTSDELRSTGAPDGQRKFSK